MYFSVLESLRLSTWRKGQPQLRLSSTNQWPNRASQIETAISSLLCHHAKPPIWSTHLPWAYTQNTLTPSATGLSYFIASYLKTNLNSFSLFLVYLSCYHMESTMKFQEFFILTQAQ